MALAAQGHSNDDIAAGLFLSTHTVRTHIQRAMMKLHARDRAQLVVIAYQAASSSSIRRDIAAQARCPAMRTGPGPAQPHHG